MDLNLGAGLQGAVHDSVVQSGVVGASFRDLFSLYLPVRVLHLCKFSVEITLSQFYLYPTIIMDYTKIGFDMLWEDESLAQKQASHALIYGLLFLWFSGNLIVSIIRTIATNPGNIPEEKEWDMSTDAASDNERETAITSAPEPE